jgi:hypothetical protein
VVPQVDDIRIHSPLIVLKRFCRALVLLIAQGLQKRTWQTAKQYGSQHHLGMQQTKHDLHTHRESVERASILAYCPLEEALGCNKHILEDIWSKWNFATFLGQ